MTGTSIKNPDALAEEGAGGAGVENSTIIGTDTEEFPAD